MTTYVVTHKPFDYDIPEGYVPILVGADYNANPRKYLVDNTGDNISSQNKNFNELTALYWMWKNSEDDPIGLSHYRRYFTEHSFGGKIGGRNAMYLWLLMAGKTKPISESKLNDLLITYDWVVAYPENNSKESAWDHYAHNHHESDLVATRNAIVKLYPEYTDSFDEYMREPARMSPYNMFYTHRQQMDDYCKWLFNILFEVQRQIDITNYDAYQQRVYGFLSERLFNVYLRHHQEFKIKYLNVFNTGDLSRRAVLRHLTNQLGITKKN